MRKALEERLALKDLAGWMADDLEAAVVLATIEKDLSGDKAQVNAAILDAQPEHLIVLAGQLLERARDRYLAMLDSDRARALAGVTYVQAMLFAYDPEADLAA